jgi:hypothetical protein
MHAGSGAGSRSCGRQIREDGPAVCVLWSDRAGQIAGQVARIVAV